MFFKSIILSLFALLLTACVSSSFVYDKQNSSFSLPIFDADKKIRLTAPKYENTYSVCSLDTFTISDDNYNYGKLFIENIQLESNCHWNGLASGYFTYEFRTRMKFKTFELVDRFIKQNYEVSTYKVDGEKYLSIIEMYSVNNNVFILDNSGKLSVELIKLLDANYEYKYSDLPRADVQYDFSLVKNNAIYSYFGKESESIDVK
jgi:hypothetical protein